MNSFDRGSHRHKDLTSLCEGPLQRGFQKQWFVGSLCLCGLVGHYRPAGTALLAQMCANPAEGLWRYVEDYAAAREGLFRPASPRSKAPRNLAV